MKQTAIIGLLQNLHVFAMAYKFKSRKVETELLSIDYQVGRTGAVTPVVNLAPVLLAGTIVKRASLHNEDIIKNWIYMWRFRLCRKKAEKLFRKLWRKSRKTKCL